MRVFGKTGQGAGKAPNPRLQNTVRPPLPAFARHRPPFGGGGGNGVGVSVCRSIGEMKKREPSVRISPHKSAFARFRRNFFSGGGEGERRGKGVGVSECRGVGNTRKRPSARLCSPLLGIARNCSPTAKKNYKRGWRGRVRSARPAVRLRSPSFAFFLVVVGCPEVVER